MDSISNSDKLLLAIAVAIELSLNYDSSQPPTPTPTSKTGQGEPAKNSNDFSTQVSSIGIFRGAASLETPETPVSPLLCLSPSYLVKKICVLLSLYCMHF